jgi:hypothetical protein
MQDIDFKHFKPHALLPFIQFKEPIFLGPIVCAPVSNIQNASLLNKIESMGCLDATCIFHHDDIPLAQLDSVLVDGLSLIYFSLMYKDLYNDNKLPRLYPFTKVVLLDRELTDNKLCVSAKKEKVDIINPKMVQTLGDLLSEIYMSNKPSHDLQKVVRAIRFFIDRMHNKVENIVAKGKNELHFEPEDAVFLSKSFETLFNIDGHQPMHVYKQQMRLMLDLNFSKPVELLWKWIDGFLAYAKLISLNESANPYFLDNENIKASYLHIGSKIFIYNVCYKLNLLDTSEIDARDLLIFFWPELGILRKMALVVIQLEQNNKTPSLNTDLDMLSNMYIKYVDQFSKKPEDTDKLTFIDSPKDSVKDYLETIQRIGEKFISPELKSCLTQRISLIS